MSHLFADKSCLYVSIIVLTDLSPIANVLDTHTDVGAYVLGGQVRTCDRIFSGVTTVYRTWCSIYCGCRVQRWYHSKERWWFPTYRLSIVTIGLSLTIRPQFAIECLGRSNQRERVNLGAQFGDERVTDVSQMLTQFVRDMWLSCAKEIVSISSAICA